MTFDNWPDFLNSYEYREFETSFNMIAVHLAMMGGLCETCSKCGQRIISNDLFLRSNTFRHIDCRESCFARGRAIAYASWRRRTFKGQAPGGLPGGDEVSNPDA